MNATLAMLHSRDRKGQGERIDTVGPQACAAGAWRIVVAARRRRRDFWASVVARGPSGIRWRGMLSAPSQRESRLARAVYAVRDPSAQQLTGKRMTVASAPDDF